MRLIADDVPLEDARFRRVFAAEAVSLSGRPSHSSSPCWRSPTGPGVAGAGSIGFNATWESTVQREVPRDALSRVIAYDMFGSFALASIGYAAGGLLGATTTLYVSGILLAALPALLWAIPGVRRLRAGV